MPGRGGLRHHANVRMVGGTVEELASSLPRLACLVLRRSAKAEPRKWGCLHFLSGSLAEVAACSKNFLVGKTQSARDGADALLEFRPMRELDRVRDRTPAVLGVLVVESRLPARGRFDGVARDRHVVFTGCIQVAKARLDFVGLREFEIKERRLEHRLLHELARRAVGE